MKKNRPHRNWRFGFAFVLLAGLFFPVAVHNADAAPKFTRSFFQSVETRSSNLKPFKKWLSALARYSAEVKGNKKQTCVAKNLNICDFGDWKKFLISIKKYDKFTQIRAVNARMNKAKYTTDKSNWGKKDYWSTPGEFMARFGDCEDYAIVKYLSLRLLGFKDDELRVVAVKDLNLKVGHAILVAILRDPKTRKAKVYVLDNQIKDVVEASTIRHYEPVFSINRTYWWRHRRG
ncbi:MAG: transglutaminase-like cysteine peptidase [Rhodospirillales bacterium]|nr:transglutaminase-like cysteine peptidase [Rhodospirillales bacterium]